MHQTTIPDITEKQVYTILFTGHMIDAANRATPRFPLQKTACVKQEILAQLEKEKEKVPEGLQGIAGGASGGDILFHELCSSLNIPTEMYLALPAAEYKKTSVSFAGKNWEDRFDALLQKLPVHTLPATETKDQNIWVATNAWMLKRSLMNGGPNMTLIALWDGKGGDGPGGTEHMVNMAKEQGAKVSIININAL